MRQAVSIIPSVLPRRARVSARQSDPSAGRGTRGNGASWPARRRARYLSRALCPHATDRPSKLSTNRGGSTVGGARGLAQPDPVPGGRVRERERNAGPFLPLAGRVAPADSGRRSRTGALREALGACCPPRRINPKRSTGPCKPRAPLAMSRNGGPRVRWGTYGTDSQAPSHATWRSSGQRRPRRSQTSGRPRSPRTSGERGWGSIGTAISLRHAPRARRSEAGADQGTDRRDRPDYARD